MITFRPQCTFPQEGPAFVYQPDIRSTMDIIWSSVIIIFLCTWSILHTNVPCQLRPLPHPQSRLEYLLRLCASGWRALKVKAGWMIFTIFVPEYILGAAVDDFWSSQVITKAIVAFQGEEKHADEIEWTLTHTHYAHIGGVAVKFPPDETNGAPISGEPLAADMFLKVFVDRNQRGSRYLGSSDWNVHRHHYSLARNYIINSVGLGGRQGRVASNHRTANGARALCGDFWTLSALQLLEARKAGIIDKFPSVTVSEIDDKSKSDNLVKTLALVQVVWLGIQLSLRANAGRQSSQMEVMALAFAVCAFITYALLLQRPKDLNTPTVIQAVRSPTEEEFARIVEWSVCLDFAQLTPSIPNFALAFYDPRMESWLHAAGTLGGLFVFGSVHLVAWNFSFPTATEQLLWRIAAASIAVTPLLFMAHLVFGQEKASASRFGGVVRFIVAIAGWTIILLFTVSRLFLLVEAFRSTYFLPPSTYVATFAENIPHMG
ncbi:hypothetical protein QBC34DRAFT_200902 [Podospora aff. communis PSN243]|uniref:Uncharacterized protein n=1 Tax=Podospora aff. communis PSN243 TaxID=3040156 RepID=A0AAV9G8U4_9PEZI|nr:hypothetical protein QBC34DRAFT_200902 [Podospora aff. communis PSN243]